jgi:PAS domain S-box-containing protein
MLRALGDNLPDGALYQYVIEPDGSHYFTYLSAGIEHLTGVSVDEGMRDADALYGNFLPDDLEHMMQATRESAANLSPFTFEARRRMPGGEIRWMSYRSRPRRLPTGATVWDGIELDITDRKRAEEALRQSEERFATVFDASPYPIAIRAYPDLRYIDVNESFVLSRGFSREELIGRTARELNLVFPEDEEAGRLLLQQYGRFRDLECRIRRKDGAVRTILLSAEKIRVDGRQCLLMVSNDITERKRAEAALQQSEERFSKAFQASPYPISIRAYPELRYVDVNESFIRSRGYRREEVIGRTPFELGLSFPEEESRALSLLEQGPSIRDMEARIRTKHGEVRTILMSIEKINLGDQLCLLVVSNDITEQKRAQQEREELIAELQEALSQVKTLSGFLPICATCKNIRNDEGYWQQIEDYIRDHSEAQFSHGVCPECAEKLYPGLLKGNDPA